MGGKRSSSRKINMKRIGILTSGGDCPGLNAVLRGAVRAASSLGWEVLGFKDGYEGLLNGGDYMVLDRKVTTGIMALGGTILGTTNKGHFVAKVGTGDKMAVPPAVIEESRATLARLRVEALICVGGDGSLTTSWKPQPRPSDLTPPSPAFPSPSTACTPPPPATSASG